MYGKMTGDRAGFLVRGRSCSLLCRQGAWCVLITVNSGSGLELRRNIAAEVYILTMDLCVSAFNLGSQLHLSVRFWYIEGMTLQMEPAFRGCFLPNSGRDLMELLYSAPFCGLNRARLGKTGVLGGRWSAALSTPAMALACAGGWQRVMVLQGQFKSLSLLWQT